MKNTLLVVRSEAMRGVGGGAMLCRQAKLRDRRWRRRRDASGGRGQGAEGEEEGDRGDRTQGSKRT